MASGITWKTYRNPTNVILHDGAYFLGFLPPSAPRRPHTSLQEGAPAEGAGGNPFPSVR